MSIFGKQTSSNDGFGATAPDAAPFVFGGRSNNGSGGTDRQAPPPPNATALSNSTALPNARSPLFVFGSTTNSAAAPLSMPQPSFGSGIDAPAGIFGSAAMSATPLLNVSGSVNGGKFGTDGSSSLLGPSTSGPSTTVRLGTNSAIEPKLGSLFGRNAVVTPFGNATSSSINSDTRMPLANLPQPALAASQGLFGPAGNSSNIPFSKPFAVNQQQPVVSSSMSSSLLTKVANSPAQPVGGWTGRSDALALPNALSAPLNDCCNGMVVDTPPPPPGPSSVFVFGRSTFIAPTGDGSARPIAAPVPAAVAAQANNEELQRLKDRLEAKKKKLARLRGAVSSKTAPVTVRADASFLVPSSAGTAKDKTGSTSCPPHQESFMQGNTIRFSNPTNPHAQSHKPDNLLPYSAKVTDDSGTLLVDLAADDAGLTTEIRRDLRDKLAEAQATLTELVAFLALDEAIEFGQPRERELLERARRQLSDVADKWEVDRKREEKHQVDLEPTQKVEEEALTLDANPQQLHDRQPEKPQRQELESSEKDRVEQEHQAQMVEMEQARMVAWLW